MAMAQMIDDSDDDGAVELPMDSQRGLRFICHANGAAAGDVPLFAMAQPVQPLSDSQVPPESADGFGEGEDLKFGDARLELPLCPDSPAADATGVPQEDEVPAENGPKERVQSKGECAPDPVGAECEKEPKGESAQDAVGAECEKEPTGERPTTNAGVRKRKAAVVDPKAKELLHDPKFKKGTRMGDFSPASQKLLGDIRTLRARENSTAWHNNFVSKGVSKETDQEESVGDAAPSGAEPLPAAAADVEPEEGPPPEQSPLTLADARVPRLH